MFIRKLIPWTSLSLKPLLQVIPKSAAQHSRRFFKQLSPQERHSSALQPLSSESYGGRFLRALSRAKQRFLRSRRKSEASTMFSPETERALKMADEMKVAYRNTPERFHGTMNVSVFKIKEDGRLWIVDVGTPLTGIIAEEYQEKPNDEAPWWNGRKKLDTMVRSAIHSNEVKQFRVNYNGASESLKDRTLVFSVLPHTQEKAADVVSWINHADGAA